VKIWCSFGVGTWWAYVVGSRDPVGPHKLGPGREPSGAEIWQAHMEQGLGRPRVEGPVEWSSVSMGLWEGVL
jgi:hypothetical protein